MSFKVYMYSGTIFQITKGTNNTVEYHVLMPVVKQEMNFLPVGGHVWPELGGEYFLHGVVW